MDAPTRLHVAVLIEEQRQPNAWEAWRFRIEDVVPDEGQFGADPRVLRVMSASSAAAGMRCPPVEVLAVPSINDRET